MCKQKTLDVTGDCLRSLCCTSEIDCAGRMTHSVALKCTKMFCLFEKFGLFAFDYYINHITLITQTTTTKISSVLKT